MNGEGIAGNVYRLRCGRPLLSVSVAVPAAFAEAAAVSGKELAGFLHCTFGGRFALALALAIQPPGEVAPTLTGGGGILLRVQHVQQATVLPVVGPLPLPLDSSVLLFVVRIIAIAIAIVTTAGDVGGVGPTTTAAAAAASAAATQTATAAIVNVVTAIAVRTSIRTCVGVGLRAVPATRALLAEAQHNGRGDRLNACNLTP